MYASKQAPFLITETNAGRHRRIGDQLPRLRRPVAAGRLGVRGPRRGDDRVLALAHQPLRHRDLLDRHPAPRPTAGPGLRRAQPARRRLRHRPGRRWSDCGPTPRSVCSTRRDRSGDWPSRRPSRQPGSDLRVLAWPISTSGPTTGSSKPSTAAPSTRGVPARLIHDNQIVGPDGDDLDPADVAAELPVLIVPGLLVADDALLIWLRDVRGGGRTPGARSADRVRRRRGPGPDRGQAGSSRRGRPGSATRSSPTSTIRYRSSPRPTASTCRRRRGDRLGRRADQRRGEGDRRLRPPALRPVPGGRLHRSRPRPDHHRRHPAEPGPGRRPRSMARTPKRGVG